MSQSNILPSEEEPLKLQCNKSIFSNSPLKFTAHLSNMARPVDSVLISLKNVDPGSRKHLNIFDKSVMHSLTSEKNSLYLSTLDVENQSKTSMLKPRDSKGHNNKKEVDISHLSRDELLEVFFFLNRCY